MSLKSHKYTFEENENFGGFFLTVDIDVTVTFKLNNISQMNDCRNTSSMARQHFEEKLENAVR